MILLTQEAIDKINGLTPGGGAEYTAGSGIAISAQNVISNTKQFDPTNTGTTGQVLKKIGNSYSWSDAEGGAMFVTQDEYDALPASKTTDGIEYIIVDTHCELKSYQQLFLSSNATALATELNTCSEGYAYKLFNEGIVYKFSIAGTTLPAGKYMYLYSGLIPGHYLNMRITNLTLQEMIDIGATQEEAEQMLATNGVRSVRDDSPIE